jgi:hypothetical protein
MHADVVSLDLDDTVDDRLASGKHLRVVVLSRDNNVALHHL